MSSKEPSRVLRLHGLMPNVMSSVFVEIDIINASGVVGRYSISELEGMRVVRGTTQGGRYQVLRSAQHIRETSSHAVFVCLPLVGELIIQQRGRRSGISSGDIGLLDSRDEYTIDISDGSDVLWLSFSPTQVEARLRGLSDNVGRRIDGSSGVGLVASKFLQSIEAEVENLANSRSAQINMAAIDLISAATSDREASHSFPRVKASRKTWERACDYIERHLDDENLSPAKIANAIGISTRYLSELFASEGQSPMGWVMHRRLEQCRMALRRQPWMPGIVTSIAFQYGFSNIPSFNRAFREAFGRSPRDVMPRNTQQPTADPQYPN
ncbi:helix-turn-helix domain-containing protein [Bradyrhizobium sp. 197]|uniref:helix-turn-helix domain-containing protein n=1 Tax=Bradyrhizobium sp. 197 TaxID=2782663 RepID=UPI001FF76CFC|nr:helix-turn-helix domain-containing protein [Bradyrhizobium sp. 197]MCK1479529.1 helix-turn-helix domain-containing protein [Bradyrhizobium sp. 197]